MTRRQFLKGTAGFVIALGLGFSPDSLLKSLTEPAIGPWLVGGLECLPTNWGADIYSGGQLAFQVNRRGAQLLSLADGRVSLPDMIRRSGCQDCQEEAARFLITLGSAGYLRNRVEVTLVENYA
jgi:hypothetical protein